MSHIDSDEADEQALLLPDRVLQRFGEYPLVRRLSTGKSLKVVSIAIPLCGFVLQGAAQVIGLFHLSPIANAVFALLSACLGFLINKLGVVIRRDIEHRRAERIWRTQIIEALMEWPLPRAADASPFRMGVHTPDGKWAHGDPGDPFPYSLRDIDAACEKQLHQTGQVLIVGSPIAGLSRTAAELARRTRRGAYVVAPRHADGLHVAFDQLRLLDRLPNRPPLSIYIDDIDQFATLSVRFLSDLRERSPGAWFIGTIKSSHVENWARKNPELERYFGVRKRLTRDLSDAEEQRTQNLYPGSDTHFGIPASLTGTASLLRRRDAGNSSCSFEVPGNDCQLAKWILDMAGRWLGTGTSRPLTRRHVVGVAVEHLQSRGETASRAADHVAEALLWSMQQTREGLSLLESPDGEEATAPILVNPLIADVLVDETTPDYLDWISAIDDAAEAEDDDALGRIGFTSHQGGQNFIASMAWRELQVSTTSSPWLMRALDSPSAADLLLPVSCVLRSDKHFASENDGCMKMVSFYGDLARLWRELGFPEEGVAICTIALEHCRNILTTDSVEKCDLLHTLIICRAASLDNPELLGELTDELADLLTDLDRICCPDDSLRIRILRSMGSISGRAGRYSLNLQYAQQAVDLFSEGDGGDNYVQALIELSDQLLENGDVKAGEALLVEAEEFLPVLKRSSLKVALLLSLSNMYNKSDDLFKASSFAKEASLIASRDMSPLHPESLRAARHHAQSLMSSDPVAATKRLEHTLEIATRHYGLYSPEAAHVFSARAQLASKNGYSEASIADLNQAIKGFQTDLSCVRNAVHALTNLGRQYQHAGDHTQAVSTFTRAICTAEAHYGEDHVATQEAMKDLEAIERNHLRAFRVIYPWTQ